MAVNSPFSSTITLFGTVGTIIPFQVTVIIES